ncbi:N-acetylglucosamine-6-phosphate deacetylase [Rickettsiales bacterium LUAb2]
MYAIINGKILNGHKLLENDAIVIKDNLIAAIVNTNQIPEEIPQIDVNNSYISSGFIDLQLNGCGGVLFNDDISLNTINIMHKTNLQFGCTSFLPTLISASYDDIAKALEVCSEANKIMPNNVLGIHIEGPFISLIKKGIHNPKYLRAITEADVELISNYAKKLPIMLTLAPEVNNIEYIKKLIHAGVIVSLGHTNASYNEAMEMIDLGVYHATHLYNAMSGFTPREPNVAGAILNNSIYTGIIVDGFHVDYRSIAIAKKLKQEYLYIVTDAVTPAGTKLTKFNLIEQEIFVENGKCVNKDGVLAGANITMISSVKNVSELVGLGVLEAVRMATLYPAKVMKNNHLGLIKEGMIANLAIFDNNYNMQYTINQGELIVIKQ